MPAAAGATVPKVCTCAITSCRLFFSSLAAVSNCAASNFCEKVSTNQRRMSENSKRTRFASICVMASSVTGKPNSFSAMARFSHSFLHVLNRIYSVSSSSIDIADMY